MAVSAYSTPIWTGKRVTLLNSAGTKQYTIKTEVPDEVIFSGKATNRPGETQVLVELFDILAPHLTQTIPDIWNSYWSDATYVAASNFARRFILTPSGGSAQNIDVRADYSYGYGTPLVDSETIANDLPFSAPIVGSARYCPAGNILLKRKRGNTTTTIRTASNATAGAVNVCFDTYEDVQDGDVLYITWPAGTNGSGSAIDGPKYTIRMGCGGDRWTLYYINAFGGLDAFWLRGICRRTDDFDREEAAVFRYMGENTYPDRRVIRIDKSITWELNTGTLTDGKARIFSRNVPGSPAAYLLKFGNDGGGWPVKVLDSSFKHGASIENDGRRPVNYTFNVQLMQDRVRL